MLVSCDLSKVDVATAAEAARILGVSWAGVAQDKAGTLTSWRDGKPRTIVLKSANARLIEKPRTGRPRKGGYWYAKSPAHMGLHPTRGSTLI